MACLGLSIDRDPWALSFGILDQAAAAGFLCEPRSTAGAARVEVADPPAAEWCSVTRVREERATARGFSAVLDTEHPAGLTARTRP